MSLIQPIQNLLIGPEFSLMQKDPRLLTHASELGGGLGS
jgi:hypothetical protein